MKDGIIKGEGNSRLLKAPATIPNTFAEFRTALINGTLAVDVLFNAAGWEVVGTLLGKSTLLNDAVADALGLTSDDPTVNEAINALLAVATSVKNGLMSAVDKAKLDGVAANANNYAHPTTAGNKHIPSGGASGQYLNYSASGTASWADFATSVRAAILTGLSTDTNAAITASDTVLAAFGKLQAQINVKTNPSYQAVLAADADGYNGKVVLSLYIPTGVYFVTAVARGDTNRTDARIIDDGNTVFATGFSDSTSLSTISGIANITSPRNIHLWVNPHTTSGTGVKSQETRLIAIKLI